MGHAVEGLHHVGVAKNGVDVYVNLISSVTAGIIAREPRILNLAKELIASYNVSGKGLDIEQDFGRIIGNSDIVETTDKDTILYAKLLKHDNYSRFVRKRRLTPSSYLSVSIRLNAGGMYELTDLRIGRSVPPFPAEAQETAASRPYWSNHAIVLDGQPLQLRTLTKTSPY